jgi:hypothetical protein
VKIKLSGYNMALLALTGVAIWGSFAWIAIGLLAKSAN